jgi:hypothetical protein
MPEPEVLEQVSCYSVVSKIREDPFFLIHRKIRLTLKDSDPA